MRGLKICLWAAAVMCLLSIFGVVMPMSIWGSLTKFFGVKSLPNAPVFEYMVRLMSATYVLVGVYFIILARDPAKYSVLVQFSAISAMILGTLCTATGFLVKMPVKWFLGDALPCIILGVLIYAFWRQAEQAVG